MRREWTNDLTNKQAKKHKKIFSLFDLDRPIIKVNVGGKFWILFHRAPASNGIDKHRIKRATNRRTYNVQFCIVSQLKPTTKGTLTCFFITVYFFYNLPTIPTWQERSACRWKKSARSSWVFTIKRNWCTPKRKLLPWRRKLVSTIKRTFRKVWYTKGIDSFRD